MAKTVGYGDRILWPVLPEVMMRDLDLECLPNWRYCQIPRGQKGPRYANWVNQPRSLDSIDSTANIGVILGPVSDNLIAIDFDGVEAWRWWDDNIGIEIPDTISWSSGRPGRCQMAFRAPDDIVPFLHTRKIALDNSEGFEFRWQGGQSVVPPSLHPVTQQPYFWVRSPRDTDIAEAPIELLAAWLREPQRCQAAQAPGPSPQGHITTIDDATFDSMIQALTVIQRHHHQLDYDTWMRVTFATAHTVGDAAAVEILKGFWPEQQSGEYHRMLRSRDPHRSPGLGSLVFRAGQLEPTTLDHHTPPQQLRNILKRTQ